MSIALETRATITATRRLGDSPGSIVHPPAAAPVNRPTRRRHQGGLESRRPSGRRTPPPSLAGRPTSEFANRHLTVTRPVAKWKRAMDVLIVLISLPLTLPCMAAVAIWVRLTSKGPAIFRQERVGRNGQRFNLYKFRSMKTGADTSRHESHFRHLVKSDSPMVKLDLLCDSRLIPGGCLLRAAGLDELPQLFNVLRGEMSLVGPRPCLPEEYRFFTPKQRERFEALPGLTGIWQVHGKGVSTFSEMNAMDALYVRRSSPGMDLAIILRTPLALLRQLVVAIQHKRVNMHQPEDADSSAVEYPAFESFS